MILNAANFLNADRLLYAETFTIKAAQSLTPVGPYHRDCALAVFCKRFIEGKSTFQIREALNIINTFSPEEEEDIAKENMWILGP
ncbi:hypothetical protein CALCODRAFT_505162 [Calocera cornea HHB12733]|uniref:SKP1 component dimerisation domain-containing protein n=1 Tax=Calocera cornea HHB12733 TaxID=1353952 RepID=A0A165AN30_9BASI|nr:hypothetical protein CALCODRAFT_505162 [Calocera cornea HHB12733]